MARQFCRDYPDKLVEEILAEFNATDHRELHEWVQEGSAWLIRKYLFKAKELAMTPKVRRKLRRGDRTNYDCQKALRRARLYQSWVEASHIRRAA